MIKKVFYWLIDVHSGLDEATTMCPVAGIVCVPLMFLVMFVLFFFWMCGVEHES